MVPTEKTPLETTTETLDETTHGPTLPAEEKMIENAATGLRPLTIDPDLIENHRKDENATTTTIVSDPAVALDELKVPLRNTDTKSLLLPALCTAKNPDLTMSIKD